jgi:hypothetical protein
VLHENRLGLRLTVKIFYWTDGGSLLRLALSYLSHWLPFVKEFHEGTHSGQIAFETTLPSIFMSPSKTICKRCSLRAKTNPRCLLVFVYTFSGWIKACPTRTEKDQKVANCLKEIIPQFGILPHNL